MDKKIIPFIIGVVIIILIVVGFVIFNKINKLRAEDILYNRLTNVVKDYYRDYYYDTLGENDEIRKTNAEKFRYTGIKITLNDLATYKSDNKEILDQFKNSQTKANCDYNKSTIVIYPTDPYDRTSIKMDANIVCGLN